MASHDELKTALMETLEKRGVVGELKAKIRQEIFAVLDESDVVKPKVRNIEFIIFFIRFIYNLPIRLHITQSELLLISG